MNDDYVIGVLDGVHTHTADGRAHGHRCTPDRTRVRHRDTTEDG